MKQVLDPGRPVRSLALRHRALSWLALASIGAGALGAINCGSGGAGGASPLADGGVDDGADSGDGGGQSLATRSCGSWRGPSTATSERAVIDALTTTAGEITLVGTTAAAEDFGPGAVAPMDRDGYFLRYTASPLALVSVAHSKAEWPDGWHAVARHPSGDLVIAGTDELRVATPDAGSDDAGTKVRRLTTSRRPASGGAPVWTKSWETAASVGKVIVLPDGDIVIAGEAINMSSMTLDTVTSPVKNLWVARLSASDGAVKWLGTFGQEGGASLLALEDIGHDEVLAVGSTRSSGGFDVSVTLARVNTTTALVSERMFRGGGKSAGFAGLIGTGAIVQGGRAIVHGALKGTFTVGDTDFDASTEVPVVTSLDFSDGGVAYLETDTPARSTSNNYVKGALVGDTLVLCRASTTKCVVRAADTGAMLGTVDLLPETGAEIAAIRGEGNQLWLAGAIVGGSSASRTRVRTLDCLEIVR
jgi:hypothetical protein